VAGVILGEPLGIPGFGRGGRPRDGDGSRSAVAAGGRVEGVATF
jgi:hypothetical protein